MLVAATTEAILAFREESSAIASWTIVADLRNHVVSGVILLKPVKANLLLQRRKPSAQFAGSNELAEWRQTRGRKLVSIVEVPVVQIMTRSGMTSGFQRGT